MFHAKSAELFTSQINLTRSIMIHKTEDFAAIIFYISLVKFLVSDIAGRAHAVRGSG
jgi:hypothetical protein